MFIFTFYNIFEIGQSFAISTTAMLLSKKTSFRKLTDSKYLVFYYTQFLLYTLVAALRKEHIFFGIK